MTAIIAALSVFDPIVGELSDLVVEWMALPEPVKIVQASTEIMTHWAKYGQSPNNLRADTGTYQWVRESIRTVLSNPYAVNLDDKPQTYQLIGKVKPPSQYPTIQYLILPLKYVPRARAHSGSPEMWLSTYIVHPESKKIRRYLSGAWIVEDGRTTDPQTRRNEPPHR